MLLKPHKFALPYARLFEESQCRGVLKSSFRVFNKFNLAKTKFMWYVIFSVVYSASIELYESMDPFPSYYFFNGLLILLQFLHIIWTYMIARIAVQSMFHNKVRRTFVTILTRFSALNELVTGYNFPCITSAYQIFQCSF